MTRFDAAAIARKCIQVLKPYVPGRSIEDVKTAYNPPAIIKLGSNENVLGTSPKAQEAVRQALPHLHLYPDGGSRNLRKALARFHDLPEEQFLIGNGSDEVLLLVTACFLNPGEKALVSDHTFSEYEFSARILDGKIVKVPLKNHRYDLNGFISHLQETPRLTFLCNPNNPTGSYFTHGELENLLAKSARETLIVVDEAYGEYATAADFPDTILLMKKYPNLVVTRTFSKLYGLAALRVGYAIAAPDIIREISRVKTPFNVNHLAQMAAKAALADQEFVERTLRLNEEGKEWLEGRFSKHGLEYIPTQSNFVCFKTSIRALELCEALARQGIIIRPLASFGLDYWNRVTIGTREQNKTFWEELTRILEDSTP